MVLRSVAKYLIGKKRELIIKPMMRDLPIFHIVSGPRTICFMCVSFLAVIPILLSCGHGHRSKNVFPRDPSVGHYFVPVQMYYRVSLQK